LWDADGKRRSGFTCRAGPETAGPPALALSPDGGRVALESDFKVLVCDAADGAVTLTLAASGPLAWSPDGRLLAALGRDGDVPAVQVFDAATGKATRTLRARAAALLWRPDGSRLLLGDPSGRVAVWDVASEEPAELLSLTGPAAALAWSRDGRTLLSNGPGGPHAWPSAGYDLPDPAAK
jgi:WD40 repeat protein